MTVFYQQVFTTGFDEAGSHEMLSRIGSCDSLCHERIENTDDDSIEVGKQVMISQSNHVHLHVRIYRLVTSCDDLGLK